MKKILFLFFSFLYTIGAFANHICNDSTIWQGKVKLWIEVDAEWGKNKNHSDKDGCQFVDCYQNFAEIVVVTSLSQLQYIIADKRNRIIDQNWVLPYRGIPIKNYRPDVYQIILYNDEWLFSGSFYVK